MNKIAVSAVAIATLFATNAVAADMAVKSAPVAPAPAAYNWTGWYVGVNAGASFGNVKTDFNNVAPLSVTTNLGGAASFPAFGSAGTTRTYPRRFHRRWANRLQLADLADLGLRT